MLERAIDNMQKKTKDLRRQVTPMSCCFVEMFIKLKQLFYIAVLFCGSSVHQVKTAVLYLCPVLW